MSPKPWKREFDHVYRLNKNAQKPTATKKRLLTIPPIRRSPCHFNWMLRKNQKQIDQSLPGAPATGSKAPVRDPWIFGRQRQEAVLELVFGGLTEQKSLVLFYTKEGHPLGDSVRRLVVASGASQKSANATLRHGGRQTGVTHSGTGSSATRSGRRG